MIRLQDIDLIDPKRKDFVPGDFQKEVNSVLVMNRFLFVLILRCCEQQAAMTYVHFSNSLKFCHWKLPHWILKLTPLQKFASPVSS